MLMNALDTQVLIFHLPVNQLHSAGRLYSMKLRQKYRQLR